MRARGRRGLHRSGSLRIQRRKSLEPLWKPVAAAANFLSLKRAHTRIKVSECGAERALTLSAEVRTNPTSSTVSDRTAITSLS